MARQEIRDQYVQKLVLDGNIDKAKEIAKTGEYESIYKKTKLNRYELAADIKDKYNDSLSDMSVDLSYLDCIIDEGAESVKEIMSNVSTKITDSLDSIKKQMEMQMDINILNNIYSNFKNMTFITPDMCTGEYTYANDMFSSKIKSTNKIPYSIVSITGNGYEGNKFVILNGSFVSDTIDTSNRDNIDDDSNTTYYEYSRLTASSNEKEIFSQVNIDSQEAKCTIVLKADVEVNEIMLSSPVDYVITAVYTSDDGVTFTALDDIEIVKDISNKYKIQNYIPGSGIVCIPSSKYVKFTIESKGIANEVIGYKNTDGVIRTINSAKRHVIRIGDLSLYQNEYEDTSYFATNNLIDTPVRTVALFANEYVPSYYKDSSSIQYLLEINGTEYEISPINLDRGDKKIICYANSNLNSENVIYVNEYIKSVILKVVINTKDSFKSPHLSSIRILFQTE